MAKSPEEIAAAMVQNLKSTTGRSLDEWRPVVRASGAVKHGEIVQLLKAQHGVTHGYANTIAHEVLKAEVPPATEDDLVAAQYAGAKAALRPIYEALLRTVQEFGDDVEVSPKKTYVSLRRRKQFALIQASTATRVDIGLNLKGVDPEGRLEASGSFNAMCTHRVRLAGPGDVDADLEGWLRRAYDGA